MGTIIGKRHIDARLEKFKEWKGKGSPQGYGKPHSDLIPRNTFDFPSCLSDIHNKVAWASDLKNLAADFRRVKPAHKVLTQLRHTGWYGDCENQESLFVGHVMQLPGKNHKERWLALVVLDDSDYIRVEIDEVYESAEDAAHAADESARILADHENEYRRGESERAEAAAKEAAKKIDSEAAWALALLSSAIADDSQNVKPMLLANVLGVAPDDVPRMLAAFAALEKNWANVSIELDKWDFA